MRWAQRVGAGVLMMLGLLVFLPGPAQAAATDEIAAAVDGLQSDPVYQAPDAELRLTSAQVQQLRTSIASAGTPIFVAILPGSVAQEMGSPEAVLKAVHDRLGEAGTYAVVVGQAFRAGSDLGRVGELADQAFAEHRAQGVFPVLTAFVQDVAARLAGQQAGDAGRADPVFDRSESSPGSRSGVLVPLLLVGAAGVALVAVLALAARRSRRPQWTAEEWASARRAAEEDVTRLGEEVSALDLDVDAPGLDPTAREHYAAALDAYDRAKEALAGAGGPDELGPVTEAVGDGRWELACVRAVLERRPLPPRRPPCFFDPQHGPSTTDVEWAPAGGAVRLVPVCAADADLVARGQAPQAREVLVGGQRRPYWDAGPAFGGWAGGYYNAWGGLLPGLLIGTVLGGGFWGWGDDAAAQEAGADQAAGWDQGGDFGGGDFGGGDFDGGDFGGGDFGGDFGGGGDF